LTNGKPYKLTQAEHYFSSGPVEVVGHAFYWAYDTIPNPGDQLSMELFVRNAGLVDTLKNLSFRVVPLDTFILCQTYSNNIAALSPGAVDSTWYTFDITIKPSTPGSTDHALKVQGYSNTYAAWNDTFLFHVYPPVGVAEEPPGVPLTTSLQQNYPNPFNPTTSIKYQLPSTNHVTLAVFDLLGREVATLVDEVKQPGTYTVEWDASDVASGMYFYRLQAGAFVDVKKLVVMR
jgi:hypothetical protein